MKYFVQCNMPCAKCGKYHHDWIDMFEAEEGNAYDHCVTAIEALKSALAGQSVSEHVLPEQMKALMQITTQFRPGIKIKWRIIKRVDEVCHEEV